MRRSPSFAPIASLFLRVALAATLLAPLGHVAGWLDASPTGLQLWSTPEVYGIAEGSGALAALGWTLVVLRALLALALVVGLALPASAALSGVFFLCLAVWQGVGVSQGCVVSIHQGTWLAAAASFLLAGQREFGWVLWPGGSRRGA